MNKFSCQVCIVGGGPAGMIAGLLLARAGIETIVLEKHADFLRDFRGDTIHPSTLQLFHELGMLGQLLERDHVKLPVIHARVAGRSEEHTSELQSLMRLTYAVFCMQKQKQA